MTLSDYIQSVNAYIENYLGDFDSVSEGKEYTFAPGYFNGRIGLTTLVPIPLYDLENVDEARLAEHLRREMSAANYEMSNPLVYLTGALMHTPEAEDQYHASLFIPFHKIPPLFTITDLETTVDNSVALSVVNYAHHYLVDNGDDTV